MTIPLRLLALAILALAPARPAFAAAGPPQMFGINLSAGENSVKNPDRYGFEYIYPSDADLDYYKSKGIDLIRVPFLWERVQPTIHGDLNDAEMRRWADLLDSVERHGMRIIPDMHNYARRKIDGTGYIIGQPELPRSAFEDVWRRLAAAWRDRGCIWAYGIMNEPYNMGSYTWKDSAQAAVNGIRASDMRHAILIPGDQWSGAHWWNTYGANLIDIVDPADNRVFEAHQYFDRYDNGEYRGTYDSEGASPTVGVSKVAQFVQWCVANKVRGFVGEYGIPRDDPRWQTTLANFLAYLKANNISGTYWAGGPWWPNDYQLDATIRPDQDEVPQWSVLGAYADGPRTRHFPKFTWYGDAIAPGETGSQWIPFATAGSVTGNPASTATPAFNGSRSLSIDYTLPAGASGGGSMHIASGVNVPGHIAANHVLSFYAKGGAGTSVSVTLATASATGAKINTGALTSAWRRFEIPLSSFLNTSITSATPIPRLHFEVFPADGVAHAVHIDLVTLAIPSTNTAPAIVVDTSTGGSSFATGQTATLTAAANDTAGPVDLVEFLIDDERVGFDRTPPYTANVTFPTAGARKLTAIAYDSYGVNTRSAPKTLTVSAPPRTQTITFVPPPDQPFRPAPITLVASASSGLPVSFSMISGGALLAGNQLTPTTHGPVTIQASQAGDTAHEAAPPVTATLVFLPSFESWRMEQFTVAERADPSVSGPLATPLNDGWPNLLKYASGLSLRAQPSHAAPVLADAGSYLEFTYTRPAAAADLAYAVEISPDLRNWISTGVEHERVSAVAGMESWRGRVSKTGTPRLFFRLKVDALPSP